MLAAVTCGCGTNVRHCAMMKWAEESGVKSGVSIERGVRGFEFSFKPQSPIVRVRKLRVSDERWFKSVAGMKGGQRYKILYVRCNVGAKVDVGVLQSRSENSTLDEVGPMPCKVESDDLA
ncbi:hypothetical protein EVAR_96870_1 [Eumeta japonica]|uniref:Uncharacterized protein n=1 Tax=Eumeta variegata TaxID=151549 RepID=A0A4C1WMT3_EUMVA|nr:hypothetical protein EVAR_96870_1 [Eumeta japonica]